MSNLDFITAKIRGMRGKLYEGERLDSLCSINTIEELAATLAPKQPIGNVAGLQRIITKDHVDSLYRIALVLTKPHLNLFIELMRRYQMENIRVMIRGKASKIRAENIKRYLVLLPQLFALPIDAMLESDSLEALVTQIPLTPHRNAAEQGLDEFKQTGRTFKIEAMLDKTYFTVMNNSLSDLKGEATEKIKDLVELETEIYNIMFTLRAAYNYGIAKNLVNAFIPTARRKSHLDLIYGAENINEAATRVSTNYTAHQPVASAEDLELAMWKNLYHMANQTFYSSGTTFATVVAFYYIKRAELANLIRISECVRYGEKADEIKAKLIYPAALVGAE